MRSLPPLQPLPFKPLRPCDHRQQHEQPDDAGPAEQQRGNAHQQRQPCQPEQRIHESEERALAHAPILRRMGIDASPMHGAHCAQVLENTSDSAVSRPVSAALSRLYSVRFRCGMSPSARTAARRNPCFQHPAPPVPLENGPCGSSMLIPEPETMTTRKAGSPAAACATQAHRLPHAYRARLARILARRAMARALRTRADDLVHTATAAALALPQVALIAGLIGGAA